MPLTSLVCCAITHDLSKPSRAWLPLAHGVGYRDIIVESSIALEFHLSSCHTPRPQSPYHLASTLESWSRLNYDKPTRTTMTGLLGVGWPGLPATLGFSAHIVRSCAVRMHPWRGHAVGRHVAALRTRQHRKSAMR